MSSLSFCSSLRTAGRPRRLGPRQRASARHPSTEEPIAGHLSNNPSTLDPAVITDTYGVTVAQQIFDGLVQYDGSLTIIPALAETWKGSRDGLSWTFYLAQGCEVPQRPRIGGRRCRLLVHAHSRPQDELQGAPRSSRRSKGRGSSSEGRAKTVSGFRVLDPLHAPDRFTARPPRRSWPAWPSATRRSYRARPWRAWAPISGIAPWEPVRSSSSDGKKTT